MSCDLVLNIKKIVLALFAVITTIVGWGMWKEPHLDFNILMSLIANEFIRMIKDPFAVFGLVLMLLGLWMLFMLSGPWTLPYSIDELFVRRKPQRERAEPE